MYLVKNSPGMWVFDVLVICLLRLRRDVYQTSHSPTLTQQMIYYFLLSIQQFSISFLVCEENLRPHCRVNLPQPTVWSPSPLKLRPLVVSRCNPSTILLQFRFAPNPVKQACLRWQISAATSRTAFQHYSKIVKGSVRRLWGAMVSVMGEPQC